MLEHLGGPGGANGGGTHRLPDLAHDRSGAQPVAGDVADRDRNAAIGQRERVVPIAADLGFVAGRPVGGRKRDAAHGRKMIREQRALEAIGNAALAQHRCAAGERPGKLKGEQSQHLTIALARRGTGFANPGEAPQIAAGRAQRFAHGSPRVDRHGAGFDREGLRFNKNVERPEAAHVLRAEFHDAGGSEASMSAVGDDS